MCPLPSGGEQIVNKLITLVMITTMLLGNTGCSEIYSEDETVSDAVETAVVEPVTRPEDWTEETHGNDSAPDYDIVFPENEVNQITITVSPENWEAIQENMTELFGEPGSGESRGGFQNRDQPQMGERPQPGEGEMPEIFPAPEGSAPPEGEFGSPGKPGEISTETADTDSGMDQTAAAVPDAPAQERENFVPPGNAGRPGPGEGGDAGIQGGNMTPENPMWVSATIEFEGLTWTNVGFRYKGNSSLTSGWSSGTDKLPFKLDFDEFEDDYPEIENQRFYGFKQLSFANGFNDTSFMRDAATSLILEEAGLPAAKTAFYEVFLDYGEGTVSLGLYTMIEVIDDTVVDRYFGSDDGNIYEAEGSAASFAASTYNMIEESFQKENNDDSDWSDIETLFDVLHSDLRTSDPSPWRAELDSVFDVDAFLEWLAISTAIQHWDSYGSMSHNYYLYNDPETGQLTWLSWDHNETMTSRNVGGRNSESESGSLDHNDTDENWPLIRFLLDDPVYYDLYIEYLAETVEGAFNPDHMTEIYQTMADLIEPYAAEEVGEEEFESAVQELIVHVNQRYEIVQEFLSGIQE
jgi:spore coat protein H